MKKTKNVSFLIYTIPKQTVTKLIENYIIVKKKRKTKEINLRLNIVENK